MGFIRPLKRASLKEKTIKLKKVRELVLEMDEHYLRVPSSLPKLSSRILYADFLL